MENSKYDKNGMFTYGDKERKGHAIKSNLDSLQEEDINSFNVDLKEKERKEEAIEQSQKELKEFGDKMRAIRSDK